MAVALEVGAAELFADGSCHVDGGTKTPGELIDDYGHLVDNYPLVSLEDPLSEDEWDSWSELVSRVGDKVQIVGDDLFVTNPERLAKGIELGSANSLLVKLNQIGTLTETLEAVTMAQRAGFTAMVSHRSGET